MWAFLTHNSASCKEDKKQKSLNDDSEGHTPTGPWGESQQEITTLAAFEDQFGDQKVHNCALGPWCIFTDFSHLFAAFWSARFGLTTNLTDKPSASPCQPVILFQSYEFSFGKQQITRWGIVFLDGLICSRLWLDHHTYEDTGILFKKSFLILSNKNTEAWHHPPVCGLTRTLPGGIPEASSGNR